MLKFLKIELMLKKEVEIYNKNEQKKYSNNKEDINNILTNIKVDIHSLIKNINEQNLFTIKLLQNDFDKNIKYLINDQKYNINIAQKKQDFFFEKTDKNIKNINKIIEDNFNEIVNKYFEKSSQVMDKQLKYIQGGLYEIKNFTEDVNLLKKTLSNVKMCGNIGELQLSMLLEQILSPNQYESNVKTKKNSTYIVEFAIKIPSKGANNTNNLWIPIDAKFPKETYEKLQIAYNNRYDKNIIETSRKNLEIVIKKMAKNIKEKYLDPPYTTNFGILFLPFEGIYSEIVKKASFIDELYRKYNTIVTGPTTLTAILNSLQIGFKMFDVEKNSGEILQKLNEIKREFNFFIKNIEKTKKYIDFASNQIDDVINKKIKIINKKFDDIKYINK